MSELFGFNIFPPKFFGVRYIHTHTGYEIIHKFFPQLFSGLEFEKSAIFGELYCCLLHPRLKSSFFEIFSNAAGHEKIAVRSEEKKCLKKR